MKKLNKAKISNKTIAKNILNQSFDKTKRSHSQYKNNKKT